MHEDSQAGTKKFPVASLSEQDLIDLLDEMVKQQRAKLLSLAREHDPSITADDLLSPHDIPVLASDPRFNFEDGILAGLLSARAAVLAKLQDVKHSRTKRNPCETTQAGPF